MLTVLQSILLGIIQGITEWLPVSSSGHLVIAQRFMDINVPLIYDIILHIATLIVILLIFYKDIIGIIKAVLKLDFKSKEGKLALFIFIASIPTAIIGLTFKDFFESLFTNIFAVGLALIITGIILFLSQFNNNNKYLNYNSSILIGISQGIAIIPGISRSGSTISTALLLGIDKKEAAKFSFLISIPAIIGAALLEIGTFSIQNLPIIPTLAGFITTIIIGYITLKLLLKIIINNKFHLFAYYCWLVGLIVVLS